MKNKNKQGFTLIELLIVIAIIGVLATLLMSNFVGVRQRARDAQRKSDLRQMQSALEIYRADNSKYPTALPTTPCPSIFSLDGTETTTIYMQKVPCDPLNSGQNIYTYVPNDSYTAYHIYACLENTNDSQKDAPDNNSTYCTGGITNWSYTVENP